MLNTLFVTLISNYYAINIILKEYLSIGSRGFANISVLIVIVVIRFATGEFPLPSAVDWAERATEALAP